MKPSCHPQALRRIFFLLFTSLFFSLSDSIAATAITDVRLCIYTSDYNNLAVSLRVADLEGWHPAEIGLPVAEWPVAFLEEFGHLIGLSEASSNIDRVREFQCLARQQHTVFQRLHCGVPVFGQVIRVHQHSDGAVCGANSRLSHLPPALSTIPGMSPEQAIIAMQGDTAFDWQGAVILEDQLVILDGGSVGASVRDPRLCYRFRCRFRNQDTAPHTVQLFVDAHSGAIFHRSRDDCNALTRVVRRFGTTPSTDPCTWPVLLTEGGTIGTVPPITTSHVQAAYDIMADWYGFFDRGFGLDSFNGLGAQMTVVIDQFGGGGLNWNNDNPASPGCAAHVVAAVDYGPQMVDDGIGHEFSHGFIQYSANFGGSNQSNAVEEGCVDILGELVDLFNGDVAFAGDPVTNPAWPVTITGGGLDSPNSLRTFDCATDPSMRWKLLEGTPGLPPQQAVRDMWRPHCSNQACNGVLGNPERVFDTLYPLCDCQVDFTHRGAGVISHGFALLCDGTASLPGGHFNGIKVIGIGPIKTAAVLYRAVTVYLAAYPSVGTTDFKEFYYALKNAAIDLTQHDIIYDPRTGLVADDSKLSNSEYLDVLSAFQAVEIHEPFSCP